MTRIKQAGPSMLIVAVIACAAGYFAGSSQSLQQPAEASDVAAQVSKDLGLVRK